VPGPWIAEWQGLLGPRYRREVLSQDEARALFEEVENSDCGPVLIDFYREDAEGRSLTVAAGGRQSVLNSQQSLDPPYFSSRGEVDAEEPTECFSYGGHETEMLARNHIPKSVAMAALAEFLRTGERPTVAAWEEV
jgi:hypothetical protein